MALDFHIGVDLDTARKTQPELQIDSRPHYEFIGMLNGSYPMLQRISDYLKDAQFEGEEIKRLEDDIKRLLSLGWGRSGGKVDRFLSDLLKVCAEASARGQNIYILCD